MMQRLSAPGNWERYIFSRQVKPDRLQLLPIPRLFPSPQKIQPPPSLKSESIACNRQYAANRSLCCCCRSATLVLGLCPLAFLLGLFLPVSNKFPSLSHQRNHC